MAGALDTNISTAKNISDLLTAILGSKGSTERTAQTVSGGNSARTTSGGTETRFNAGSTESKQTMVNPTDIMTQILGATGKYYGGPTLADVVSQKKRAGLYGGATGLNEQRFLTQAATEAAVAAAPTVVTKSPVTETVTKSPTTETTTKEPTVTNTTISGKGSTPGVLQTNGSLLPLLLGVGAIYAGSKGGKKKLGELWDEFFGDGKEAPVSGSAYDMNLSAADAFEGATAAENLKALQSISTSSVDSWMLPAGENYVNNAADPILLAANNYGTMTDFGASAFADNATSTIADSATNLADSWSTMTDAFGGSAVDTATSGAADMWTSGYDLPIGDAAGASLDIGLPGVGSMFNLITGNNAGGNAGENAVLSMIPVVGPALALVNSIGDNPVSDIVNTVGDWASDIGDAIGWIICTELYKQNRLSYKLYVTGAPVFAAYPEVVKRGYYLWAVPTVSHLKSKPNSWYSKLMQSVFTSRAQYLFDCRYNTGNNTIMGAILTHGLYAICYGLGAMIPKSVKFKVGVA